MHMRINYKHVQQVQQIDCAGCLLLDACIYDTPFSFFFSFSFSSCRFLRLVGVIFPSFNEQTNKQTNEQTNKRTNNKQPNQYN